MFKPMVLTSVVSKAVVALVLSSLTSPGFASGGSGGGGGTGGGGGACSVISSLSVKSGVSRYGYPWDRVDVSYVLKGCSAGFVPAGTITVTNLDNGLTYPRPFAGLSSSITIDHPYVTPYNANVRVDFVVADPVTGAVIESRSVTTLCPPAPAVRT
jgi:hypothetical protein